MSTQENKLTCVLCTVMKSKQYQHDSKVIPSGKHSVTHQWKMEAESTRTPAHGTRELLYKCGCTYVRMYTIKIKR